MCKRCKETLKLIQSSFVESLIEPTMEITKLLKGRIIDDLTNDEAEEMLSDVCDVLPIKTQIDISRLGIEEEIDKDIIIFRGELKDGTYAIALIDVSNEDNKDRYNFIATAKREEDLIDEMLFIAMDIVNKRGSSSIIDGDIVHLHETESGMCLERLTDKVIIDDLLTDTEILEVCNEAGIDINLLYYVYLPDTDIKISILDTDFKNEIGQRLPLGKQ